MVESLDLEYYGRKHLKRIYRNLPTPMLYEKIISNREGQIAHLGPVVVRPGQSAEISAEDKFVVKDPYSTDKIIWGEEKNSLSENHFNILFHRLLAYMHDKEAYVQDCLIGSVKEYQTPIRIVTETAWHSLFSRSMFYQIKDLKALESFSPKFTIIHAPGFTSIPELEGTRSSSFVILNLSQKLMLIGGSGYAGEIKHAVFTIANYLMPESVFCMRGSANAGPDGDVAIFLGREETGKTALAVDPERKLIADHTLGWSDKGIFSLEWGGYAKALNMTKEKQPTIYDCTRRFGTLLENVTIDPETRRIDLTDKSLTENTRVVYPISHLLNSERGGIFAHPKNLFLLTCDAFGVLPPIAKLTADQAIYAFMSAYTSKPSTSSSGEIEPQVMFSVCFGDTLLALPAHAYGKRLMENIKKNNITCWLLNTGWSGEPCTRSERIPMDYSRALVRAAVSGALEKVSFEIDPLFQFEIPCECPGGLIPSKILNPRETAEDSGEYELRAMRLVAEFTKDFEKYGQLMPEEMREMMSQILSLGETMEWEEMGISI
jgi:phosphoenolpyruvate carboxykinase (ATP)